jgi:hypothetical protein
MPNTAMAAIRLVEYNVNGPHKYGIMDRVFGYHIVAVLSSHIFRGNTDRKNPINKLIRNGMAIANILGAHSKITFHFECLNTQNCELIFSLTLS